MQGDDFVHIVPRIDERKHSESVSSDDAMSISESSIDEEGIASAGSEVTTDDSFDVVVELVESKGAGTTSKPDENEVTEAPSSNMWRYVLGIGFLVSISGVAYMSRKKTN